MPSMSFISFWTDCAIVSNFTPIQGAKKNQIWKMVYFQCFLFVKASIWIGKKNQQKPHTIWWFNNVQLMME